MKYTTSVVGFSLLSFVRTSYNAFFFVTLEGLERPQDREPSSIQAIKQHLNQELSKLPEGIAFSFLAAGHSRRRHFRRIHVRAGGPRRQGRAVPRRQPEQVHGRGAQTPGDRPA